MRRRRWSVRVHRPDGEQVWMVVEVPTDDGTIYARIGDSALMLDPEDLSKLRQVFQDAQAVALYDKGTW